MAVDDGPQVESFASPLIVKIPAIIFALIITGLNVYLIVSLFINI